MKFEHTPETVAAMLPDLDLSDAGSVIDLCQKLELQRNDLVAALELLLGNGFAIRAGFCEPNPYRKHTDSWRNWESSASENAELYDEAEKQARAVLAKTKTA